MTIRPGSVIARPEDLDELPVDTIVLDRHLHAAQRETDVDRQERWWAFTGTNVRFPSTSVEGPVTVVWLPAPPVDEGRLP